MNDSGVCVIRYGGYFEGFKGTMTLKLDKLFPQNKEWLIKFERRVLRYCHEREEVLNQLTAYLKTVKIPGLPKEFDQLDKEIAAARHRVRMTIPESISREIAEENLSILKNRKARFSTYCERCRMNLEILESFKKG